MSPWKWWLNTSWIIKSTYFICSVLIQVAACCCIQPVICQCARQRVFISLALLGNEIWGVAASPRRLTSFGRLQNRWALPALRSVNDIKWMPYTPHVRRICDDGDPTTFVTNCVIGTTKILVLRFAPLSTSYSATECGAQCITDLHNLTCVE
jgi:hypothetical protein